MRKPEFTNLLHVLQRQVPERPTLFELFLNQTLYQQLAGEEFSDPHDALSQIQLLARAFAAAGYDYATVRGSDFHFPRPASERKKTRSLNDGCMVRDRRSFQDYPWPDPDSFDYGVLAVAADVLPTGMKLIPLGPGGVLENVIDLVGYENLCYMLMDDPDLVEEIFAAVGSRLVRYYELASPFDTVGAVISNDHWGFKTQTMLSTEDMRRLLFPCHDPIAAPIHAAGKPAILHSCGNLHAVMDDVIDGMGYDAKHSYEDTIMPVEDAYELWGSRIAILGGIDVDFLCVESLDAIRQRSVAMLERAAQRGGYALGSGNSIPEYIPQASYFAMTSAALAADANN